MKKVNVGLISRRFEILTAVFIFLGMVSFTPAASATIVDLSGLAHFLGFSRATPPIDESKPEHPAPTSQTKAISESPTAKVTSNTVTSKASPSASKAVAKAPAKVAAKVPAAKNAATSRPVVVSKPSTVTTGLPNGANKVDYEYRGFLVSSIYYNASIRDEAGNCGPEAMSSLRDAKGGVLMKVCAKTVKTCLMEGVCQVTRKKENRAFNYSGMVNKRPTFFELKNGDCVFGFGVMSDCLDPFYTLAADMRYHRAGEVIYIPQIVGTILPGGQRHSGFFIVRDMGQKIQGSNRFDFFTGPVGWKDNGNPFFKMDLSASQKKFTYYRVTGSTAERFHVKRNFPKLPDDPMFDVIQQSE